MRSIIIAGLLALLPLSAVHAKFSSIDVVNKDNGKLSVRMYESESRKDAAIGDVFSLLKAHGLAQSTYNRSGHFSGESFSPRTP